MGQNAMTAEDKERRRNELLDAALRLFRERGDLPSVAEIARAAGLAKGTVYLYFESKEEIFIALLEGCFVRLFVSLGVIASGLEGPPKHATRQFAQAYAATLLSLESFLPLASRANGVFEKNLPIETLRRFKTFLANCLDMAGEQLEVAFPELRSGEGATLLLQTYALTLGLWQALDYPAAARKVIAEPALKTLDREFAIELESSVRALWLGFLAAR